MGRTDPGILGTAGNRSDSLQRGTWGPAAASALIGRDGLQWREEEMAGIMMTLTMSLRHHRRLKAR